MEYNKSIRKKRENLINQMKEKNHLYFYSVFFFFLFHYRSKMSDANETEFLNKKNTFFCGTIFVQKFIKNYYLRNKKIVFSVDFVLAHRSLSHFDGQSPFFFSLQYIKSNKYVA